jgi:hypothetical protein
MKKLILSFVFGLGLMGGSALYAQTETQVREESRPFSKGTGNCLVINLPGTKKKEIEDAWEAFVKQYKGKTKFDKKAGEYFSDECTIKDMSPDKVDIHTRVAEVTGGTEFSVWFDLGASTFLSSKDKPQLYPAGDKLVKEFASTVSFTMIEEQLKAEEKKLKEIEEGVKKLEKDKIARDKDIADHRETIKKQEDNIRKAEDDIKQNLVAQEAKRKEVADQKKVVDEIAAKLKKVKKK